MRWNRITKQNTKRLFLTMFQDSITRVKTRPRVDKKEKAAKNKQTDLQTPSKPTASGLKPTA